MPANSVAGCYVTGAKSINERGYVMASTRWDKLGVRMSIPITALAALGLGAATLLLPVHLEALAQPDTPRGDLDEPLRGLNAYAAGAVASKPVLPVSISIDVAPPLGVAQASALIARVDCQVPVKSCVLELLLPQDLVAGRTRVELWRGTLTEPGVGGATISTAAATGRTVRIQNKLLV